MNTILKIFLITLLAFITACSSAYKPSLTQKNRDGIQSLHVVVITAQKEIDAQFIPSNSGAIAGAVSAGAIGALIGSAIDVAVNSSLAREAEESVESYRDMLADFDFHSELSAAVRESADSIDWSKIEVHREDLSFEDFVLEEYLALMEQDAMLVFYPSYSFSPSHERLNVDLSVGLYYKSVSKNSKRKAKPITTTHVHYQSKSNSPRWRLLSLQEREAEVVRIRNKYETAMSKASSRDDKLLQAAMEKKIASIHMTILDISTEASDDPRLWSQAQLLVSLNQGIDHVSRLAVWHLTDPNSAEQYQGMLQRIPTIDLLGRQNSSGTSGYKVTAEEDHIVYRMESGTLNSIPAYEPLWLTLSPL